MVATPCRQPVWAAKKGDTLYRRGRAGRLRVLQKKRKKVKILYRKGKNGEGGASKPHPNR
jgi:hypothetical protein